MTVHLFWSQGSPLSFQTPFCVQGKFPAAQGAGAHGQGSSFPTGRTLWGGFRHSENVPASPNS